MKERLKELLNQAESAIQAADSVVAVEALRVQYLGKKGALTILLREVGSLAKEERPAAGQLVNEVRGQMEERLQARLDTLAVAERAQRLEDERVDITMPGRAREVGNLHPLSITYKGIRDIFTGMGFTVYRGPEIEYDKYNFDMLNIPKDHPARDTQDTFYINDAILLRTQTSPGQIRVMLEQKPPIRVIIPGRVYRADDVDATHSPIFNQVEGLVVDEDITMGDLKGVLDVFVKNLYGPQAKTRFRPGYFPFTEPSAEVDATCAVCQGAGCRVCKGTGWIEILGCGMVHPRVLENVGLDPGTYQGFAFGLGLDRIANIRYGIHDIRMLFENDIRFLKQFRGAR
ncbi:MAG: phenylalanine--tRNA ligase subunit alpha [Bacillota bacterium]